MSITRPSLIQRLYGCDPLSHSITWQVGAYALLLFYSTASYVAIGRTDSPDWSDWLPEAWQLPIQLIAHYMDGPTAGLVADVFLYSVIGVIALAFLWGAKHLKSTTQSESQQKRRLYIAIALISVITLFLLPFHSTDLYGYINRGAQQALYGLNPYAVTVAQTPGWQDTPIFQPHWVNNPTPYGFFLTGLPPRWWASPAGIS